MIFDYAEMSASQRYFQTIQTLIPRPIAWVLSENDDGGLNLAPFSYFSAVCSEPPLIMISVGRRPEDAPKDTRANIEARENFVVHIPHRELLKPMNESAASLPAGTSEVERLGLKTTPFPGSALPRLADCRVAYACRLFEIKEIGPGPQSVIFGEVTHLYVDDTIVTTREDGRLKVDAERLDPVARLGAGEYGFLRDVVRVQRPK